jgi:hypothetical protein
VNDDIETANMCLDGKPTRNNAMTLSSVLASTRLVNSFQPLDLSLPVRNGEISVEGGDDVYVGG